jgi:hypothetical protein
VTVTPGWRQRTAFGQRLGVEHVEVGVRELLGIERGDEIRDDYVRAAREVDHPGAFREEGKSFFV